MLEGVSGIDRVTISNCQNLICIVLPNTIKLIRENAFSSTSIEIAELSASLITIEDLAFVSNLYSRYGKEKFAATISLFRCNCSRIPLVLIDNWGITKDSFTCWISCI